VFLLHVKNKTSRAAIRIATSLAFRSLEPYSSWPREDMEG